MLQPDPLLFPHLSLPCTLHYPSLPGPPHHHHPWLCSQHASQGAQVPTGLALHAVLQQTAVSTSEPQWHQQEQQTPLPPPSSVSICLSLSVSLGGGSYCSLHLSVPSLFTPWPPSAPLFVHIQIFLHWNRNFVSLFSLFCPKIICFLKRAGLSRLLMAERGQEVI